MLIARRNTARDTVYHSVQEPFMCTQMVLARTA